MNASHTRVFISSFKDDSVVGLPEDHIVTIFLWFISGPFPLEMASCTRLAATVDSSHVLTTSGHVLAMSGHVFGKAATSWQWVVTSRQYVAKH